MGGSACPALASAMASLFKKKTVDGEWGGGALPRELAAPCPSRSPGAAVTSPRTASGAELALAWLWGSGSLGVVAVPARRPHACVPAERELVWRGEGHSPPGVTHRRRSGRTGRRGESPGRAPGTGRRDLFPGTGPCEVAGTGRGVGAGPWRSRSKGEGGGGTSFAGSERTKQAHEELLKPGTNRGSGRAGLRDPALEGGRGWPQAPGAAARLRRAAADPPLLAPVAFIVRGSWNKLLMCV